MKTPAPIECVPKDLARNPNRTAVNDNGMTGLHVHPRDPTMQLVFEMMYGRERMLAAIEDETRSCNHA